MTRKGLESSKMTRLQAKIPWKIQVIQLYINSSMNWAKVTSYQAFLAALRVAREGMSKRIPLPSDIYSRPPCIWRNRAASPRASLGSPSRLPCLPRIDVLSCVQKVLWEEYLLAACMRPLSLEITCRWDVIQIRSFPYPLLMSYTCFHLNSTGTLQEGPAHAVSSWFHMAAYFLILTYK